MEQSPQRSGGALATGIAVTAVLAVLALALALVGLVADDEGGGAASAAPQTVEVSLIDGEGGLSVEPASIEVPPGTQLTVVVTNDGTMPHDLKLDGTVGTAMLDPGASETVDLGSIEASTSAWCTVPGHRDGGMEMQIVVTGDGGGGSDAGGGDVATGAQIDFAAEASEGFEPRDPTAPVADDVAVHEITLTIEELELEVAPGVTQKSWTFGGTVPGPTLRGKVGDVFDITLVNPAESEVSHSIDFHASKVAWDDEMRSIAPGEQLVYRFEATAAGIFMYHCGTAPVLHHIGNGMFGGVIIDPPALPAVDREYVLVQSEIYTGEQGEVADLGKMIEDDWDAVVFNGYANQYKFAPIRVEVGERVRVWVLDTGPSENSSFHIVGTIFDTVFKEGAYRLQPGPTLGGAQALDLQPAQGGFVEFTLDEAGLYPIVTHKFSNVGKGALGLFQAGEVPDREADGRVTPIGG